VLQIVFAIVICAIWNDPEQWKYVHLTRWFYNHSRSISMRLGKILMAKMAFITGLHYNIISRTLLTAFRKVFFWHWLLFNNFYTVRIDVMMKLSRTSPLMLVLHTRDGIHIFCGGDPYKMERDAYSFIGLRKCCVIF
jgi:hypothetical protein